MPDQNPYCTFNKIMEKIHSNKIRSHSLTFRAKVKVIAKIKSHAQGNKKHASTKEIWGSLINWCDADEDEDEDTDEEADADTEVDISKIICRPPPHGGST